MGCLYVIMIVVGLVWLAVMIPWMWPLYLILIAYVLLSEG